MGTSEPSEALTSYPAPDASPNPTVPDVSTLADLHGLPAQPGVPETVTQPSGEAAPDAPAVHTFQVTHKVANPENPENHSLFTSAELTVDEAIAWIRERLLRS